MNTLEWNEDNGCAYKAKADIGTYVVDISSWLVVVGPRGGTRYLPLGSYKTVEQAKLACERRHANEVKQEAKCAKAVRPEAAAAA